ncbi:MAG TPA: DUF3108 domain-containing protein, partial [Xanthomonadales bacterium]|nr:DUF3108 domain-containing protein [Xanthomonadales bacterium]
LKRLYPARTRIDDGAATWLADLPLEAIDLEETRITDATVAALARISTLRAINASGTRITDAGGAQLAALANLEVDERTVFRWNDGCPELIESSYDQRAAWTSRKRSLRVDAASGTIASFDGKRLHTLAFAPCTIDVHLSIVALMAALSRGDEAPAFRVATRDEVESHAYARSPAAAVETPTGVMQAVRAERIREDDRRRSAFWFASALDWLPVRVEYADAKGERIELRLAQSSRRAR